MKPSGSERVDLQSASSSGLARTDWQHYTPTELERQYNARATVPDVQVHLDAYRQASDTERARCPQVRTLAYGPHPSETLDIFPVPGQRHAPALVFVHGGYWRALGREDSSFMASALRAQGIATVAIEYALAPTVRLEEIVAQCRRSLQWLWAQGAEHGVDPTRMVLAGSSAGAHLAAMMLSETWRHASGLPERAVQGAVLVSGLYDLQPVRQCLPNTWLQLSEAQAEAMSPLCALPAGPTPLCLVVAAQDTDEFKRQSQIYGHAAAAAGCAVQHLEIAGRNHFDVILDWMQPDSALSQATLGLWGSRSASTA